MNNRVRIEIVETSADQPWHCRMIRNEKTWTTEKYARKVGAQRAVLALAKTFGWATPFIEVRPDGRTLLVDLGKEDRPEPIPVLFLREMDQVAP